MPSKNNISAFKGKTSKETILPADTKNSVQIGRPKKVPSEKRSSKITLSFTEEERGAIKEKAGLISEATYLYNLLKENKLI